MATKKDDPLLLKRPLKGGAKSGLAPKKVKVVARVVPPVLKLSSAGIPDVQRATHGAAVAVNDDWDNGHRYTVAGGGHRIGEPIWDLNYFQQTLAEDDLLQITLDLTPNGRAGNVTLAVTAGGNRIRLWPAATKGTLADIITPPDTVLANTLPQNYYVEGLTPGRVVLRATYNQGGINLTDDLVINVVDLQETQGGARKVIYTYNQNIQFQVLGGPANYTYDWDLDGNGNFNAAVYETPHQNADTATCRYGAVQAANTVGLVANNANKRQIYDVAVRLTGGLVLHTKARTTLGGATTRGIRVALPNFQGAALPAQSTVGLHTRFNWNDNNPITFDAVTAGVQTALNGMFGIATAVQGANRIQYGTTGGAYAETVAGTGAGNAKRVYMTGIYGTTWANLERSEDLDATVNHEIKHLQQYQSIRDNNPVNNAWRLVNLHYVALNGYRAYLESEAYLSELRDGNVGWRHHTHSGPALPDFVQNYNAALAACQGILVVNTRASARLQLQRIYRDIPFEEMKRTGYDRSVRAPL